MCTDHGVQFQAYSTLGTQHRTGINPVLRHPVLNALAEARGRTARRSAPRPRFAANDALLLPVFMARMAERRPNVSLDKK